MVPSPELQDSRIVTDGLLGPVCELSHLCGDLSYQNDSRSSFPDQLLP